MLALIDADIIIYQCAAANQEIVDWGDDDDITVKCNKRDLKENIADMLGDIQVAAEASDYLLCFSSSTNFRKDVYPSYKGNRKAKDRPIGLAYARKFCEDVYQTKELPGLEADDLMGVIQTGDVKGLRGPSVICSIDKDMLTIPGLHYQWNHAEEGVFEIEGAEAWYAFYTQVLTGDSTDNYPGCPGVGPKTAEKILGYGSGCAVNWPAVVEAYEKAGLTEDDAIVQARCARILRAEDYDFEKKEVILWTP